MDFGKANANDVNEAIRELVAFAPGGFTGPQAKNSTELYLTSPKESKSGPLKSPMPIRSQG